MRIGGMGSGMDTEYMLQQIMKAERMPLDRLHQQKQVLEWKQEDYRELNSQMFAFRNTVNDMTRRSNMMQRATSSTNENVATASATRDAQDGHYRVKADKLAERSHAQSDVMGIEEGQSLDEVKLSETNFMEEGFEGTVTINGAEIEVSSETTVEEFITAVNESDANVQMFYDSGQDRLFLSSNDTGEGEITISLDGQPISGVNEADKFFSVRPGNDAEVQINGFTLNPSENEFAFGGVNYSITETGETTVNVGLDHDNMYEQIENFVEEYNKLLLNTNEKLKEPIHRDYPPLTDTQKEQLSDREIEQWEELSRTGHLRNDAILNQSVHSLRRATSERMEGEFDSLSAIGITTGDYREGGILHIDETKLREAIESDPEGVFELFSGNENSDGIVKGINDSLTNSMDRIGHRAGRGEGIDRTSYIGRSLRDIDNRIDRMEDRLERVEERHWKQFTAMEKALYEMHSQGNWLHQQLVGM
ncbi:flagellar filament capping protein FliD [Proteinivorax tanatarense]|uniref:Flagellar hook-associated protein 2 n=1 Tax=Proteinivorax tanatarense TaxID=1260629 RepID=A0AAU7VML6_9FIRM